MGSGPSDDRGGVQTPRDSESFLKDTAAAEAFSRCRRSAYGTRNPKAALSQVYENGKEGTGCRTGWPLEVAGKTIAAEKVAPNLPTQKRSLIIKDRSCTVSPGAFPRVLQVKKPC